LTGDEADAAAGATTEDRFLGGALKMRQPRNGYRAGLDAVLLAAACPARGGGNDRCLDCGAGVGVAGLAVAHRLEGVHVTMIERDATSATLASRNAVANFLDHRTRVIVGDLTAPLASLGPLVAETATFDHVLANPPYYARGAATAPTHQHKAGAHSMADGQLEQWVRFAAAMTRAGGSFTMIHRPDALREMLIALQKRFGRIRVLPLHPRQGAPASRVILQAIKGSRAGLQLLAGRVLHLTDSHAYAPEFEAILRHGAALAWSKT
jgi:tRNA1(Val) A37 N6-methylase TrmN6